jgi:hypothetical protein
VGTIASNQDNVGEKRIAIVLLLCALAVAFHDVGGEELCRMAVRGQHMDNASQVLEQCAVKPTLFLQTFSKSRWLKILGAKNAKGSGCRCHNVFSAAAFHSHGAQSATADI